MRDRTRLVAARCHYQSTASVHFIVEIPQSKRVSSQNRRGRCVAVPKPFASVAFNSERSCRGTCREASSTCWLWTAQAQVAIHVASHVTGCRSRRSLSGRWTTAPVLLKRCAAGHTQESRGGTGTPPGLSRATVRRRATRKSPSSSGGGVVTLTRPPSVCSRFNVVLIYAFDKLRPIHVITSAALATVLFIPFSSLCKRVDFWPASRPAARRLSVFYSYPAHRRR